jgi:hypothetical protein
LPIAFFGSATVGTFRVLVAVTVVGERGTVCTVSGDPFTGGLVFGAVEVIVTGPSRGAAGLSCGPLARVVPTGGGGTGIVVRTVEVVVVVRVIVVVSGMVTGTGTNDVVRMTLVIVVTGVGGGSVGASDLGVPAAAPLAARNTATTRQVETAPPSKSARSLDCPRPSTPCLPGRT